VYNHEYNVTRPVEITPSRHWGGQGALGCTLGYGALHRIPASLEEPPHGPGETMFDTSLDEKNAMAVNDTAPPPLPASGGEFLVPADLPLLPPAQAIALPPKRERRQKHQAQASPSAEMDDYFREGEEQSRKEDRAPSTKAGSGIPPPPKAGGPPKVTSLVQ